MPKCSDVDAVALIVHMTNADIMKLGKLPVWTIYDHPRDYPEGFVARMHVPSKGPSNRKLYYDLADLRAIFKRVGLVRIRRQPEDDKVIVESWL